MTDEQKLQTILTYVEERLKAWEKYGVDGWIVTSRFDNGYVDALRSTCNKVRDIIKQDPATLE